MLLIYGIAIIRNLKSNRTKISMYDNVYINFTLCIKYFSFF